MIELLSSPAMWLSLLTLIGLEVILGVDNLIFISIAVSRLALDQQKSARLIGLGLALILRLLLLYAAAWLTHFQAPLFTFYNFIFSIRDLFLLMGGLFLLVKATNEIHLGIAEANTKPRNPGFRRLTFVIIQIILLDLVFSFDSIMTAIGLTNHYPIMAISVIVAIVLMMLASNPLHRFITRYPSLKVLALSFLMLIGMGLVAEGMHFDIPHGYIYFAMLFSIGVELLNIATGKRKSAKENTTNISPLE